MGISQKAFSSDEKGFTLIETLVSLLVISFVLTAAVALVTQTLNATTVSQDRYIASKLAVEGIELIKAKRNRNVAWNASQWTLNIIGSWEVDSVQTSALSTGASNRFLEANVSSPRVLCKRTAPRSVAGKYAHICPSDASEPLPGNFTRIVEVSAIPDSDYSVQVTVTVTWNGGDDELKVSTVLYRIS